MGRGHSEQVSLEGCFHQQEHIVMATKEAAAAGEMPLVAGNPSVNLRWYCRGYNLERSAKETADLKSGDTGTSRRSEKVLKWVMPVPPWVGTENTAAVGRPHCQRVKAKSREQAERARLATIQRGVLRHADGVGECRQDGFGSKCNWEGDVGEEQLVMGPSPMKT